MTQSWEGHMWQEDKKKKQFNIFWKKKSETGMIASILKQDPNN